MTKIPAQGPTSEGRGELAGGDVQAVRFHKRTRTPNAHDQRTLFPGDIEFEDGEVRRVPTGISERILGKDSEGDVVVGLEGMLYLLTPCCYASGKGWDSETGVVCRSCFQTVDPAYGGLATIASKVVRRG